MVRLRRYRAFLVVAVIAVIALYQLSSLGRWRWGPRLDLAGLKNQAAEKLHVPQETLVETKSAPAEGKSDAHASSIAEPAEKAVPEPAVSSAPVRSSRPKSTYRVPLPPAEQTKPPVVQHESFGGQAPGPSSDKETRPGQGRLEMPSRPSRFSAVHWTKFPDRYPVPPESVIALPTAKPRKIPKIQHEARQETEAEKTVRESRLAAIKEAMTHTWTGYREHAWLRDELRPVSGKSRDPFCGWAATLVDTLDTLWIMGLTDEFDEAAKAVNQIDFTTSTRDDIPLFETTIRYLGGLLGAYDISNGKYRNLLDKAVELAEILLSAFDTPNRMPVTFYQWRP